MSKAGLWLNASIAVVGIIAFTVAAVIMGYKWVGEDEVDRAYACGSGSRGGLCTSGETTNMVLTLVFGVLAVGLTVLLTWGVRAERRKAQRVSSRTDFGTW